jgi:hypothetical protein
VPTHTVISALIGLALFAQSPAGWDETSRRGQQLMLDNKTPQAIALFERVVKSAPDFDAAHYELGEAYRMRALELALQGPSQEQERQRHLGLAATHLQRAAAPAGLYEQLAWGKLMMLYGKDELNRPLELVNAARQYVRVSPSSVIGHVNLARALRTTGQDSAALAALMNARRQIAPDGAHLLAVTIVDFVATTSESRPADFKALLDYAEAPLKRAIADDPSDRQSVMAAAALFKVRAEKVETDPKRRAALLDESNRLFERFLDMNPNRGVADAPPVPAAPADAARTQADALAARRQFVEAAAVYEKFTRSNPEFLPAHYLRIDALVRAGEAAAIDAALEAARRSVPATAEKRYEAATYLFDTVTHTKDIAAAEANKLLAAATVALDDALTQKPEYIEALVYKSLVLRTRAPYEPNAEKAAALTAEADRLRARVMELQKRR